MINLFLKSMSLTNFKGVRHAEYAFEHETHIFGQNATGKSSIVDAFCWLMFNKSANGDAPGSDKFHEKPLDADGKEVHGLDTTVEASFMLDGKPFNLRRTQRENWVKKRGNAEATFQGNVSTYWINEVETKSTDFNARINSIANGDTFRLITSLGAFNAMNWKDRRTALLDLCGMDVDAELLKKSEYADIAQELAETGCTVDDLKKVLTDRKRKVSQELNLIPARIDEANRLMPDFKQEDVDDAHKTLKMLDAELEEITASLLDMKSGNADEAALRKQIASLRAELTSEKLKVKTEFDAKRLTLISNARAANDLLKAAKSKAEAAQNQLEFDRQNAATLEKQLEALRAEYRTAHDAKMPEMKVENVCPTCGQPIPAEQIEATIAKAKEEFETKRKAKLKGINEDGKQIKAYLEKVNARVEEVLESLKKANAEMQTAANASAVADAELAQAPSTMDYSGNPRIAELESTIAELENREPTAPNPQVAALMQMKADTEKRMTECRAILAKEQMAGECAKRVSELSNHEVELGEKLNHIEVMISDVEHFIADRCNLMESGINALFPTIRWKLFNRQINGALVDCCECMIPCDSTLVPYSAANTAAAINADIEIIDVLSKYSQITAPLFVDNAERINYLAKTCGQLITLSVDNSPTLTIKVNS